MGQACFAGQKTVEVDLAGGGTRRITGDRVFLNLGTHATVPALPGLAAAMRSWASPRSARRPAS